MKNLTIVALFALLIPAAGQAAYLPNAELLSKMEKILGLASILEADGYAWKEARSGQQYQEGEGAVFAVVADSSMYWQFEEWKLDENGDFNTTVINMWPNRAERWHFKLTYAGRLLGIEKEELDVHSPQVIAASERAQELLLKFARPIVIGGKEM